jgi:6-pyruvoyltetrahydropterin/6-carboxytetrahydropterin synthase
MMLILRRSVRFAINTRTEAVDPAFPGSNGFAGIPAMRGLARFYEVNVACAGEPHPASGYLVNIKDVDRAVRDTIIPRLEAACATNPDQDPASILPSLLPPLDEALGGCCTALRWYLSPYYCLEMARHDLTTVLLRQKFDFAASHRLHIPSLSDEDNRAIFGKCNHPGGHGHNYQFEPCLAIPLASGAPTYSLAELEALCDEVLIQPFDHKHLNQDTAEFDIERGGLNPTVENIARTFYDLLAAALAQRSAPVELRSMTVWETDRTSATYPA